MLLTVARCCFGNELGYLLLLIARMVEVETGYKLAVSAPATLATQSGDAFRFERAPAQCYLLLVALVYLGVTDSKAFFAVWGQTIMPVGRPVKVRARQHTFAVCALSLSIGIVGIVSFVHRLIISYSLP